MQEGEFLENQVYDFSEKSPSLRARNYADDEKKFLLQMARDLGVDGGNVVSEIYSPPRVTDAAKRLNLGIAPGFAFDLTTVVVFSRFVSHSALP